MISKPILVLLAFLASLVAFGIRVYPRFSHMMMGQKADCFGNWLERIKALLVYFAGQARLFRFKDTGTAHFFIFWGFLLLFPTILQGILEGLFPGFVLPVLGTFGPILLFQDLIAVAVIVGVLYGLYYRLVVKPERYKKSHQFEGSLVLVFIFTIMFSLLCTNGLMQNLGEAPPSAMAGWRPVSAMCGSLFEGMSEHAQHTLKELFYWIHLGVVLVFLPLLPAGKHFHVITSLPAVFLRNLEPPGKLSPAQTFDGLPGVGKVENFTWRQMLDWYTCSECGRCQEVCPAYNSGAPLSPKLLMMDLRDHLYERGAALRRNGRTNNDVHNPLNKPLTGDVIADETLWACTTCYACDQECPLFVEHVQPIVDMRRFLLTQQRVGNELMSALNNLRRYGNSFGKSERQRALWTKGFNPKIKDIRKSPAQTLWFLGDYASYNPTLTEITQATARVFTKAGLDFGVLYDAERNAGNDVRRVGEDGLFELLRQKNKTALEKCEYEQVVTTDPHTYNTLKNEYELNGKATAVYHYTELLDKLIAAGQLPIKRKLGYTVTYHDPCYLGRYNNVYDPPRRVLKALGCQIVEMPRNRDRALCCGAGGGRIWMEEQNVTERPSENRIREAIGLTNVEYFVVACPKDVTMYCDAVKTTGNENTLQVKDLIELVEEALQDESATATTVSAPADSESTHS